MDICRIPVRLPAINRRFNKASSFRPMTVKSQNESGDIFFLGMGFVGQFFAADLKSKGWVVNGSCTSITKKKKLEQLGYQAYVFDANQPQHEILEVVKNHTHLVVSIPPIAGLGDPVLREKELVESMLKNGRLEWLGYLSSTNVYGDCSGAWVDEDYPAKPANEHARARLAAEEEWLCLGHNLGVAAHVFRLGGIYGPGRSAVDTILKQEPMSKGQKKRLSKTYTSRVHVADICQALHASILKPSPGKIYNVVDDDPAPREEVFMFAKKLVKEKFPNHGNQNMVLEREDSLNPEKGSKAEKRVANARMKKELGINLIHPTYRSGLRSIVEHVDSLVLQNSPGS